MPVEPLPAATARLRAAAATDPDPRMLEASLSVDLSALARS